MGYYPKMYNLGSATEALKKPEKPKSKPISTELKAKILKEPIEETKKEPIKPKEDKKKDDLILIAVPCYKTIHIRTAWAITETIRRYPNTEVAFQSGVFVHENQNNLVELAKEKKASYIFLVEHDIVFEPDTLETLLSLNEYADFDVVVAPYSDRYLPKQPLVYQKSPKGELYKMNYDVWPDKPFKAYGVPTGCTLIKMRVFDKIEKPYFFFTNNKEGVMQQSQDIYFSKKVNEAGMECWVDPSIPITHIGEFDFTNNASS
jgi:hypothetical protein